jgi:hypothetical protein
VRDTLKQTGEAVTAIAATAPQADKALKECSLLLSEVKWGGVKLTIALCGIGLQKISQVLKVPILFYSI